jgi:hypothetical protein
MANIRAIMTQVESVVPAGTGFTWGLRWVCFALDGSGGYFDIQTSTTIAAGDTSAATMGKLVDSIVAAAVRRGDTLARTNCYLIDYVRGS